MRNILAVATALTVLPMLAFAAPLSKTDANFVRKAAIGGMAEVQEGQTALSNASSPDLKTFAQKMVTDHTANNMELMTLASGKGADVPAQLDKMHMKEGDALSKKTGADFDTLYIKDQVKGHQQMEKVMQNEIDHGDDADLKAFATKTLPVVQDHLGMAKALRKAS